MSQTGYSKVQIYSSSTATNTPSASNLTNDTNGSELAINITDGKLFYKDNGGTVQVIASKASNSGSFTTLSGSTSTTTPIVQSSGSLLLNTNGTTTAVTIDTSQNVGVGVTPNAWGGVKAIQIFDATSGAFSGSGYVSYTSSNCYYVGGTWYRGGASYGSNLYSQFNGQHNWNIAGSGSAGSAISFTQAMTLDNSGNLFGGNTTTGTSLSNTNSWILQPNSFYIQHVSGSASGTPYMNFIYNAISIGSITQSGTGNIALNGTSDRRLKSNIVQITTSQSGPIIDALKPSSFTWIDDNKSDVGFIADEMQAVIPNAVMGEPNATKEEEYEITPAVKDEQGNITTSAVMGTRTVPVYQQVNMTNQELIAYLVAEVQSLRARLKAANIA